MNTDFKKSAKPVGVVGLDPLDVVKIEDLDQNPGVENYAENYAEYAPFITTGIVSLPG